MPFNRRRLSVNDLSSEFVGTATVGTADWLEASRDLTLSAYVPGELVDAPAPQQVVNGSPTDSPNSSETVSSS
jgi:hypothetical protein